MVVGFSKYWSRVNESAAKLTILIRSRIGRYRDGIDGAVRLPNPSRGRDFGIFSIIGRGMDQGLECSSNTVCDESTTAQGINATIHNNLGHLPNFVPRNEHELIIT